jgi:hypothetical protein
MIGQRRADASCSHRTDGAMPGASIATRRQYTPVKIARAGRMK